MFIGQEEHTSPVQARQPLELTMHLVQEPVEEIVYPVAQVLHFVGVDPQSKQLVTLGLQQPEPVFCAARMSP